MGGITPSPAEHLRHLIDHGPEYQPPQEPLPPLWDDIYQHVKSAKDSAEAREDAFFDASLKHPDYVRVRLLVQDALLPGQIWGVNPETGLIFRLPGTEPPSPIYREKKLHRASVALLPHQPPFNTVQDLILPGSLNLFVGESGAKKTYAALDLAVNLAMGKPWLDRKTRFSHVLWIDEEIGKFRFPVRLAQVMRAHDAPKTLPFYYASMQNFDLCFEEDVHSLKKFITKADADVLIIDPFIGVIPGTDENSLLALFPHFQTLRSIAHQKDTAIILIHHTNKSGIYRGSTHLRNTVDLMLHIDSKSHTNYIEFKTLKTREIGHQHFAAQIHFDPPGPDPKRVYLTPADLPTARLAAQTAQPINPAVDHVLNYLQDKGPSKTSEIINNSQNCTAQQARSAIYKLIRYGIIDRTDKGGSGNQATFALIE